MGSQFSSLKVLLVCVCLSIFYCSFYQDVVVVFVVVVVVVVSFFWGGDSLE